MQRQAVPNPKLPAGPEQSKSQERRPQELGLPRRPQLNPARAAQSAWKAWWWLGRWLGRQGSADEKSGPDLKTCWGPSRRSALGL